MIKLELQQHLKQGAVILILKLHHHRTSNSKKQKALLKVQELRGLMHGKTNQCNKRTSQIRKTLSKKTTALQI